MRGAGAVGKVGAGVGGDFRHGLVERGDEEDGVVAEAAFAARGGKERAIDGAGGGGDDFAVAGGGEYGSVVGFALVWSLIEGQVGGVFEQALEVALVGGEGGVAEETLVVSIAGGADAGFTVERGTVRPESSART